jgi:histidine triad (HIT) family protein
MSVDSYCSFCRIVGGFEPAHIVYEDADSIAFLDREPAAEGHTLVVPRLHARTLLDIAPTSAGALMTCRKACGALLDRTLHPDGMTMVQTNEHAGGQTVFHVHLHIVPRWEDDNLITPWKAERADDDVLTATRAKMLANFDR